jgi:hypothetical protein
LGFMSLRASLAEGKTLLISARREVAEKDRARTALGLRAVSMRQGLLHDELLVVQRTYVGGIASKCSESP